MLGTASSKFTSFAFIYSLLFGNCIFGSNSDKFKLRMINGNDPIGETEAEALVIILY